MIQMQPTLAAEVRKRSKLVSNGSCAGSKRIKSTSLILGRTLEYDHAEALLDTITTVFEQTVQDLSCKRSSDNTDTSCHTYDATSSSFDGTSARERCPAQLDWSAIAQQLQQKHSLKWTPRYCQGLWKFLAYADATAAVGVRPHDNVNLLEESDEEDLEIDPRLLTKRDFANHSKEEESVVQRARRLRLEEAVEAVSEVKNALPFSIIAIFN
ncbi:hypothetical protein JKP88DRAFT_250390 [Tribonema minus]|uniref:Uncharacterized protein n=1 Tax=Tribonema minus TaxID=303371 RepID=A0A835YK37_9STRA|nr:hypothetical protein JKP88DRAFT_250390 [Tribonema minus]